MEKTNIKYVCYWVSGHGRPGLGLYGYNDMNYPWERLEDGGQIISISYDQDCDMYIAIFKVREE